MKKALLLIAMALLATGIVFAGAQGEAAEDSGFSGDLAMGGSTTVAPIIDVALEAFEEDQPNVDATYASVGSSNGIAGVKDGVYMIGGSSKSEEKNRDAGVYPTRICIDGIACVVSANVPVDDLSRDQITAIYTGEITNWSEVGGNDAEIVVLSRDEASGTYDTWETFTVDSVDKSFRDGMIVVVSNGDLASKLATTPNAIGYIGAGFVSEIGDAKVVTVDGVEPTEDTIKSFEYPYSRYLYLVTMDEPEEGSLEAYFINWLKTSREGRKAIADVGYYPLDM